MIEADQEPTDEEVRRFDKGRKDKKVSNDEWQSSTDPERRIAKMKDGRTHLAYKAEHVVDLKSELILAAEIYPANRGDTDTLVDSVMQAKLNLERPTSGPALAASGSRKWWRTRAITRPTTLELADALNVRTYIPEPKRQHDSRWTDKPEEHRAAVLNNRRRTSREKSRKLQRLRSERVERSFAHTCETGGARRSWLRGVVDVTKRYLMTVAAHNLGRVLRKLFGVGKPRALQGDRGLYATLETVLMTMLGLLMALGITPRRLSVATLRCARMMDHNRSRGFLQQAVRHNLRSDSKRLDGILGDLCCVS